MDIQAEKLSIIQWLAGINDKAVIKQLKALKKSKEESEAVVVLSPEEKKAVEKGLKSIKEGKVRSHREVMQATKKKYPQLFK